MQIRALPAALVAVLSLAGCAQQAAGGAAAGDAGTGRQDALLAFAQCMREQGVNMPDPQFDESGQLRMEGGSGFDASSPAFERAESACEQHLDGITAPSQASDPARMEQRRQQLAAFAECMRREGIDFADPEVRGGAVSLQMRPGDWSEADVKRAESVCRDELPEEERQQMTGGGVH